MSAAANAVALIVCPLGNAYLDGSIMPGMPLGGVRWNMTLSSRLRPADTATVATR